ncbi:MAG: acyltransferase family protein, partial [Pseudomonadota bacterium]
VFFFLSGYVYARPANLSEHLVKLVAKLVIPYFLFLFAISLPANIATFSNGGWESLYWRLTWLLRGGQNLDGAYTAFWFVPCFFFTSVLFAIVERYLSLAQLTLIALVSMAMATVDQISRFGPLPLAIEIVAMSFPILFFGYWYRRRTLSTEIDRKFHWAVTVFGFGYLALLLIGWVPSLNMKYAHYGWPVITVAAATSLVIAGRRIFLLLNPEGRLSFGLCVLGKASLLIMFVHQPIQLVLLRAGGLEAEWPRFALALSLSILAYTMIQAWSPARILLLGRWPRPAAKRTNSVKVLA